MGVVKTLGFHWFSLVKTTGFQVFLGSISRSPCESRAHREEFLARAKILKDQGMAESEIVRQLNAELRKCPGVLF